MNFSQSFQLLVQHVLGINEVIKFLDFTVVFRQMNSLIVTQIEIEWND